MIMMKNHALCALAILALASCSSDSRDGDPNFFLNLQQETTTTSGTQLFFQDHGDGTVSITYDHRNPMHITSDETPASYSGSLVIPATITVDGNIYQVTGIDDYAFLNCDQLTSVELPASIRKIGKMAFYKCTALEKVNIPAAVKEIPDYCFYSCKALKDLTLYEGLTTIGYESFHGCAMETVVLPATVTTVSKFAFSSCSKMKLLSVPASVTTLTDSVFYNCSGLKKVTLPETLNTLGTGTFAGCRGLSEVTIPASVTAIGPDCFSSLDSKTGESNWKNITLVVMSPTPITLTGSIANATARRDLIIPRGSRETYEQADYWKEFTKIFERNY